MYVYIRPQRSKNNTPALWVPPRQDLSFCVCVCVEWKEWHEITSVGKKSSDIRYSYEHLYGSLFLSSPQREMTLGVLFFFHSERREG